MEVVKTFGFVIMVLVVTLVCLAIFKFVNKDHKVKTEYDERQKALKGRGYMFGFYATVIWDAIVAFFSLSEVTLPISTDSLYILGIFVGITVVCIHGIWNEAYWGLNNDKKKYIGVFAVLFVINVLPVVMYFKSSITVDFPYANAFCSLMIIAIGITSALRRIVDKKEEE